MGIIHIGVSGHDIVVRSNAGAGIVDLGTVEDVSALHLLVGGLDPCGVGAGAGLGNTESASVDAFGQVREVLGLLFLRAKLQHTGKGQRGVSDTAPAIAVDDLHDHAHGHHVRGSSAVFLGNTDSSETRFKKLPVCLLGEAVILIAFLHQAFRELPVHKFDQTGCQQFLFFGKLKIHIPLSFL